VNIGASANEMYSRVREALSNIASVRELDGKMVVNVPVLYPSGASVAVEVEFNRDRCWVSDMGTGKVEAEYLSAADHFSRAASEAAERFSVNFDGYCMFALWVPASRLEAAIVSVANASSVAASEAIRSASEKVQDRRNDQIFQRIKEIFGEKSVAKSVEVTGRHASWNVHNVVLLPDRSRAVFEFMTRHANSVSSKYIMFADMKHSDESFSLNAVVADISSLDSKAQIISDVANIVSLHASDEEISKFARAS
jgi:hypothetical protein